MKTAKDLKMKPKSGKNIFGNTVREKTVCRHINWENDIKEKV